MSYVIDPAGPAANNVLDGAVFQDLQESLSQPERVAAVYRKFVENAAYFIDDLRTQDAAARIETLHTLKGSAAMMGANAMANLAAQLQSEALSVQVELAIQQLTGELDKFRVAVSSKLVALGASLDTSG